MGMTMSQLAAANRRLIADAFMQEGDTEYDVATPLRRGDARVHAADRRVALLRALAPPARADPPRRLRHRRGLVRAAPPTADEVTVCFADMVDFTQLGETLDPEALGAVTGRLGELAAAVVEPPVRLVKMIGDAAMIVGPEPAAGARRGARAGRGGRAGGRRLPAAARRRRHAAMALPRCGRLVRAAGQPRQPDHRDRPSGQRARRPRASTTRSPTRRLRLVVRRIAQAQGDRRLGQGLSRSA